MQPGEKQQPIPARRPLDQAPVFISPELMQGRHMTKHLQDLTEPPFSRDVAAALDRIQKAIYDDNPSMWLMKTERETIDILKTRDFDVIDIDPDDQTHAMIADAVVQVGNNPEKIGALDVLYKMYLVSRDGIKRTPPDISWHIAQIVGPPAA